MKGKKTDWEESGYAGLEDGERRGKIIWWEVVRQVCEEGGITSK